MSEVTRLLEAAVAGDRKAAAELLPMVYEELRKLAAIHMAQEAPEHTLQPTALVHEAYLRLIGPCDEARWDTRGHFFAAAAKSMRRILVDHARRKQAHRHGGGRRKICLSDYLAPEAIDTNIIALDEALSRLATEDPVAAQVAELRRFTDVGHEQVAAALGQSLYEARRKWMYARAWLRDALDA